MSEDKPLIDDNMTLFSVVENYPETKEILIDISDYFKKLDDPDYLSNEAKNISLKEASTEAKLYLREVMYQVNDAIGLGATYLEIQKRLSTHQNETVQQGSDENEPRPSWMADSDSFLLKDVRNSHEDPFNMLNALSGDLTSGEGFRIIQRFEPMPLLQYMKAKGFDTFVEQKGNEEFYIYFYKK